MTEDFPEFTSKEALLAFYAKKAGEILEFPGKLAEILQKAQEIIDADESLKHGESISQELIPAINSLKSGSSIDSVFALQEETEAGYQDIDYNEEQQFTVIRNRDAVFTASIVINHSEEARGHQGTLAESVAQSRRNAAAEKVEEQYGKPSFIYKLIKRIIGGDIGEEEKQAALDRIEVGEVLATIVETYEIKPSGRVQSEDGWAASVIRKDSLDITVG